MTQRGVLSSLWLASFSTLVCAATLLQSTGRVGSDSYRLMISQLSASFVPYLSVVLAFFFSDRRAKRSPRSAPKATFALALVLSVLWNALILAYVLPLVFGVCCIEDSVDNIRNTGAVLAWLVGPAIGFYFGSRT